MANANKFTGSNRSSIGIPDFYDRENSQGLEVHLFNFDQNIYSKRLKVQFINKIREEKKFENLDMLKSQIQKDITTAKNLLK